MTDNTAGVVAASMVGIITSAILVRRKLEYRRLNKTQQLQLGEEVETIASSIRASASTVSGMLELTADKMKEILNAD